jgi:hypothetical protein
MSTKLTSKEIEDLLRSEALKKIEEKKKDIKDKKDVFK